LLVLIFNFESKGFAICFSEMARPFILCQILKDELMTPNFLINQLSNHFIYSELLSSDRKF